MIDRSLHALALRLLQIEAIKFGAFRLKLHETEPDAPLSPIYANLRTAENPKPGPLTSTDVRLITTAFAQIVEATEIDFDGMCGIPNAATPYVADLRALGRGSVPVVTLKKETDEDRRWIDRVLSRGGTHQGETILLIDDVISAADTKIEAIEVLRAAGYEVNDLLLVLDRQQNDGVARVESHGVRVHAVFTLRDLLDFYLVKRKVSASKRNEVLAYAATN